MNPTSIYRYYDADRRLIYVGITGKGMVRQAQHNSNAEWWRFVSTQEVEHVESRHAALHRERELIERFRPPFNREHNPDWQRLRADYLAAHEPKQGECDDLMRCDCWWAGVREGSSNTQDALAALIGGVAGDPVVAEAAEAAVTALTALVDTLHERRNHWAGPIALAIPEQAAIDEYAKYATGVSA